METAGGGVTSALPGAVSRLFGAFLSIKAIELVLLCSAILAVDIFMWFNPLWMLALQYILATAIVYNPAYTKTKERVLAATKAGERYSKICAAANAVYMHPRAQPMLATLKRGGAFVSPVAAHPAVHHGIFFYIGTTIVRIMLWIVGMSARGAINVGPRMLSLFVPKFDHAAVGVLMLGAYYGIKGVYALGRVIVSRQVRDTDGTATAHAHISVAHVAADMSKSQSSAAEARSADAAADEDADDNAPDKGDVTYVGILVSALTRGGFSFGDRLPISLKRKVDDDNGIPPLFFYINRTQVEDGSVSMSLTAYDSETERATPLLTRAEAMPENSDASSLGDKLFVFCVYTRSLRRSQRIAEEDLAYPPSSITIDSLKKLHVSGGGASDDEDDDDDGGGGDDDGGATIASGGKSSYSGSLVVYAGSPSPKSAAVKIHGKDAADTLLATAREAHARHLEAVAQGYKTIDASGAGAFKLGASARTKRTRLDVSIAPNEAEPRYITSVSRGLSADSGYAWITDASNKRTCSHIFEVDDLKQKLRACAQTGLIVGDNPCPTCVTASASAGEDSKKKK